MSKPLLDVTPDLLKQVPKASAVVFRRAGWVSDADWDAYLASLEREDRMFVEADLAWVSRNDAL